jgi:hypothetical protein
MNKMLKQIVPLTPSLIKKKSDPRNKQLKIFSLMIDLAFLNKSNKRLSFLPQGMLASVTYPTFPVVCSLVA